MVKVFVSGSLTQNGRYHNYYVQGKPFLGAGHIEGYTRYILGGLDGIVPREGGQVQGEVYELDEKACARLDFFHNSSDEYFNKIMVEVRLENGDSLPAQAFIWKGSVQ